MTSLDAVWLQGQENEDVGRPDCGCVLYRDYAESGDPAFVFCPMHAHAHELLKALRLATEGLEHAAIDLEAAAAQDRDNYDSYENTRGFCRSALIIAKDAIAKAKPDGAAC